ncbi:unnamed protein product, partial [marine sediment metagenome]
EIVPFEEAQKEAAKAFGKEAAQRILGFLSDITRPPAKELGGLLADHVKFFRLKTQLKIIRKAQALHQEYKIRHQQVPLKIIAHLLDSCSWEEDEWMQRKWATLLANAATLDEKVDNYPTHVELLGQLSPVQARCLDLMYNENVFPARRYHRSLPSYQSGYYLQTAVKISGEDLNILCDSLIRLNLIHPKLLFKQSDKNLSEVEVERDLAEVSLTFLGQDLVKKCRIPFSKMHLEKIRRSFAPIVDQIAKDHDGQELRDFIRDA